MNLLTSSIKSKGELNNQEVHINSNDDRFQELYNLLKNPKLQEEEIIISIILPMYNEQNTIRTVLEKLPNHESIEIIVVDDHSTDDSLLQIEKARLNGNLKVISHKRNKGYGAAVLTGIKHSNGKIMVTMDSDGQHSPDDIISLVKPIIDGEADYTIGSRYLGTYFYQLPVSTRLGEILIEKTIQIFFGKRIMNNQNGFRAFNRKLLPIFDNIKFQGYAFCTEQILKASLEGYKIKECPIKVYDREFGSSNIILSKLAYHLFLCVLQYLLKRLRITIFRKTPKGDLAVYEKLLKKSSIYRSLRYQKELQKINSVFFIERPSLVF
ncbi:MAG: glycosyltransferase family 2 protein [Promethearchaeota archaeon]